MSEERNKLLDELESKKESMILQSMRDYNSNFYTNKDVDECGEILNQFINKLKHVSSSPAEIEVMPMVQDVVERLNKISERCGDIIETDQREYLCDFIIKAVNIAGYKTDDDITEQWREW